MLQEGGGLIAWCNYTESQFERFFFFFFFFFLVWVLADPNPIIRFGLPPMPK